MKVRKITNISDSNIGIILSTGNVIIVGPKGILENKDISNLDDISEYVKVELDLSEVNPVNEKKKLLID